MPHNIFANRLKSIHVKSLEEEQIIEQILRDFTHLNLDLRAKGSYLQGNTFTSSIQYILELLKIFETTDLNFQHDLKNTENYFNDLMDNENLTGRLESLIRTTQPRVSSLEELQNKYIQTLATELFEKLQEKGQILMPGGWNGAHGGPGHAMLYHVLKQEDGSYHFIIYNTGAGSENHHQESEIKDKFIPIMSYRIEKFLNEYDLKNFLIELLTPRIVPLLEKMYEPEEIVYSRGRREIESWQKNKIYDASRVYGTIQKKLRTLDASKIHPPVSAINPNFTFKILTQGQMSGTCSMRVLMVLLRIAMSEAAFKRFCAKIKFQSIQDLFALQTEGPFQENFNNQKTDRMLQGAIQKLQTELKKIDRKNTQEIFLKSEIEDLFSHLSQMVLHIKSRSRKSHIPHFSQFPMTSPLNIHTDLANSIYKRTVVLNDRPYSEHADLEKQHAIVPENILANQYCRRKNYSEDH